MTLIMRIGAFWCVFGIACSSDTVHERRENLGVGSEQISVDGVVVGGLDGGAIEEAPGCDGVFSPEPLAPTPSVALGAADCASVVKSDVPAFWADCQAKSWTLDGCSIPYGQRFCHHGYWTTVCRSDRECPAGTRCTTGSQVGMADLKFGNVRVVRAVVFYRL